MRSLTVFRTTTIRSCASCRASIRCSRTSSPPMTRRSTTPTCRRSIAWAAGSVATARAFGQTVLPRHAVIEAQPYGSAAELRADLDVIYRSLHANGSALLARGRLRSLRRAVEVFGFHLASVDLRQNSDVHERVVAELGETATGGE